MRTIEVQQGSDSWHAERARRFTASEAPAVMGAGKYLTRSQLLHQKATGIVPEVDAAKQRLFDRGHEAEAAARAIVEDMIGEDLYPATGVHDEDDRLLASLDGITMLETVIMEHKLWSEDLAAQVRAGELEPHYYWQLEAQLLVSGAEKAIFVCSDGTREKFVHMEYRPVAGRAAQLLAAWDQFERDLAAYVQPAASAAEKIVAEPVEALPAPVVQVGGQLTLQDNFKVFEERLRHFLEHRLIREPKSDEDFVNLDAQIKAMKQAREALGAAEAQMLAQVEPIDRAKKTKDMLDKLLQQNVSMAERQLKNEKERRKSDIVAVGVKALADHIAALNLRLGKPYMPQVAADFGGVIGGLKSLASMEDKVATELARAKIAASEIADRIQANLNTMRELASEHAFLFADTAQLVLRDTDACRAIITARIAEHRAAEERRAAELAERERERIRAEEAAKAEKAARDRMEAEQRATAAAELAAAKAEPEGAELSPAAQALNEQEGAQRFAAHHRGLPPATAPVSAPAVSSQAANVLPLGTRAPETGARLRLGEINAALTPIALTADGLAALGFQPVATEKAAKLYAAGDFPRICAALIAHVSRVSGQQRAA